MAKTFTAPFTQRKILAQAVATTANTNFSSTSIGNANLALLYTTAADGALVKRLSAIALGSNGGATQLQIFRQKVGGSLILWRTKLMANYAFSASTENPVSEFSIEIDNPWGLEPGEKIYVGISVATTSGIGFSAEIEEF